MYSFPHIHSPYQHPFMYERFVKLALLLLSFVYSFVRVQKATKKHHYHQLMYVLICLLLYFYSTCYIFSQICSFHLPCHVTIIISLICKRAFVSFCHFGYFVISQAWSLYSASSGMCNSLVSTGLLCKFVPRVGALRCSHTQRFFPSEIYVPKLLFNNVSG